MNALERLGLEVAAFNLLGSRGKAALLCCLIDANGRTVPHDILKDARAWRMPRFDDTTAKGLKARVSWLREALEDVGLAGVVVTDWDGGNTPGRGYALPEPGRSAVIARLIEEAGI